MKAFGKLLVAAMGALSLAAVGSATVLAHDDHVILKFDSMTAVTGTAVGAVNDDLTVKASGAQQSRVEDIGAIGCRDNDDAFLRIEAIHLAEVVDPREDVGGGERQGHRGRWPAVGHQHRQGLGDPRGARAGKRDGVGHSHEGQHQPAGQLQGNRELRDTASRDSQCQHCGIHRQQRRELDHQRHSCASAPLLASDPVRDQHWRCVVRDVEPW